MAKIFFDHCTAKAAGYHFAWLFSLKFGHCLRSHGAQMTLSRHAVLSQTAPSSLYSSFFCQLRHASLTCSRTTQDLQSFSPTLSPQSHCGYTRHVDSALGGYKHGWYACSCIAQACAGRDAQNLTVVRLSLLTLSKCLFDRCCDYVSACNVHVNKYNYTVRH